MDEIGEKYRSTHAEEIKQLGIVFAPPPERERGPNYGNEKHRVLQQELAAKEVADKPQRRFPRCTDTSIPSHMSYRDPLALGVPVQNGQRQEEIYEQGYVWSRPAQLLAGRRPKHEEQRPA